MKILIKNIRVINPASKKDEIADILIDGDKISKIAKSVRAGSKPAHMDRVIDGTGKIAMPALIDMHVHARQPGREDKETIASAAAAAAKGGIGTILTMPNTEPAIDSAAAVKNLNTIIKREARARVFVAGAITRQRAGKKLTDFARLKKSGAIALSDDGSSIADKKLMLEAFKKSKKANILISCHSEDEALSARGVVNSGIISTRMGLRGISRESEYKCIARDIELAKKAGTRVHIAHVSCRESVEIISRAKKQGAEVTAETAPHYFALTEEAVLGFDTNMKMNPPLRGKEDRDAVIEGLRDGTIDVIASDHAPHTDAEKDIEFDRAAFGVIGLETELSLAITELVDKNVLDWMGLAGKMAYNPAKILGLDQGRLATGARADIVIISPDKSWALKKEDIISKSKNSCFLGKKLKGVVEYTIFNGEIIYQNGIRS